MEKEEAKRAALPYTKEQDKNLKAQDKTLFEKCFRTYDANNDGTMCKVEFKNLMMDIGEVKRTGEHNDAVTPLLDRYDQDKDGNISWTEFIDMMIVLRGKENKMGEADGGKFTFGDGGAQHTVSIEECVAFANTINDILKDDKDLHDLNLLPI